MNKSKFLKKSLAALLAILMVVAMVPLSAAAAEPTLSGASVTTDVKSTESTLTVNDAAGTITGEISLAAKSFTLYLLPRDNTIDNVSVSYEDLRQSDRPVKGVAEKDAANERWAIGKTTPITFSQNDFLMEDGTVQMKITVQDDNSGEKKEYTVILTRTEDPSDPSITSLRVWTRPDEIGLGDKNTAGSHVKQNAITDRVPQLNATKIDQTNKIIDITVPFNTNAVWVRDFELANGAQATISVVNNGFTTVDMSNEAIIIEGSSTNSTEWDDAEHDDPTDNLTKPNVAIIPIKVTAGTHTSDYILRLTRASGIESFTVKDAIDSRVFPEEGKIVVVMPFGYTNDNKVGTDLTVVPEFSLQYSETNVPELTWESTTLKSGETKIKFNTDNIKLDQYDYKTVAKRLQNAKDYADWSSGLTLANQSVTTTAKKLTVSYVESTDRVYEVVVVEPKANYEAKIDTLDIGTETATIDEASKTIDIELPTGKDLTKVALGDIKIYASDAATVTLPMNGAVTFVEDTTTHTDHATTNAIRSVLTLYENASGNTINATNPITVRVKSQDGSTTADYTLNITVSNSYVKPAITSLTLQSADQKTTLTGSLNESTGIYTVEVPYSFKTTESLKGFKVFYQKSAGSSVTATAGSGAAWGKTGFVLTGAESYLTSPAPSSATDYKTITSNSRDTSTKGSQITVSVRNPFTNQMEEEVYYILLVRKAPGHVSSLKSLSLTSNGSKVLGMDLDDVNDENTYVGSIKGTDIEVKLPWSHYEQNAEVKTNYTESDILTALRMVVEKSDENATVWYKNASWDDMAPAPVLGEDSITSFLDGTGKKKGAPTDAGNPDWEIVVLSEQISVDYESAIQPDGTFQGWKGTVMPNVPKTDFTVYHLYIDQDSAKVSHVLNSLKLVAPSVDNWNVGSQELQIRGNTITGSIPFSMVNKDIYLDYAASPRAFVLGGENSNSSGVFTTVYTENNLVDLHNAAAGYPNSSVGHFDDWGVYDKDNGAGVSSLLPNGGASIRIDEQGNVTMYSWDGTNRTVVTAGSGAPIINKLIVTSEDTSKGVGEYTFDLTVRPASNENKITSFKLEGQVGDAVINNETDTINVTVSSTVELTALKTTWTLSDGATLDQSYTNGEPINYSTERLFTVRAENGTSTRTYRVNVSVQRGFVDVPEGVWFYDDVMTASDNGWIAGVGDGRFNPYGTMTRGQFATIIARMDSGFKAEDYTDSAFPDVSSDHYASAGIAFCADKGYFQGDGEGNFNPDNAITRQEAAIVMCKIKGISPASGRTTYVDDGYIAGWAVEYVKAASAAGIFKGDTANAFNPNTALKRCEGAAILVRAN